MVINYIQRTQNYYHELGYPLYEWAQFPADLLAPLEKPLSSATLALVTTAAPVAVGCGEQGPGAAYNAAAKFFDVFTAPITPIPDLRISHIAYDRRHCEAKDPNTWLPVPALQQAVTTGRIGQLAERLIGAPTNRSQRVTQTEDAPAVLDACRELAADAVLLVPT